MSDERIGIERALPMFLLGLSCICVTAIVVGILCGNMIRARRAIEKVQQKNETNPSVYVIHSQNANSFKFFHSPINNKLHNSNQTPSTHSTTTTTNLPNGLDSIFKHHPQHSTKRIIEL